MRATVVQRSTEGIGKVSAGVGSVLLLAPQIYAHGGVQTYMRRLSTIINAYCSAAGRTCVPLAIGRIGFREADTADAAAVPVIDAYGSKPRFVLNAFRAASDTHAQLAVVGHTGLAPVALALKSCGLVRSYVLVLHGIEAWQRLSVADGIAARRASAAIATTDFTARKFAEANGFPFNRIAVVPLALGEQSIPQPVPSGRAGGLRVLTVGRLASSERYKGVDYLIDAVASLTAAGMPVTLDIVGDGDDAPALKQRAAASGKPEAIRFHGAVSDDQLACFYRSCDVFAMPSLNEGFGIVFLEAMKYGKPCIGGRHGGTPEIIRHGINGLLVQHGDVDELITCLQDLASDPDLCRKLGGHAYETVADRYCLPRMQADWFGVLETALASSKRVRR